MNPALGGDDAQRVRACLECGELLPFEERSCPHCGHHEAVLPGPHSGQLESCPECGQEVPAGLIFCPRCGSDRGPEPAVLPVLREMPIQAETRTVDLWALLLTLLGPLLMAAAVLAVFCC